MPLLWQYGEPMEKEKTSTARIVRDLVMSKPMMRECMVFDVINYSAAARLIEKEIEEMGFKTTTEAIKMSLLRLREELKKERNLLERRIQTIIAKTVIELQSDLTVITAKKEALFKNWKKFSEIMEEARFFQLTQGLETFTVVISSEQKKKIMDIWSSYIVDVIEEQTAIVLISPKEIMETPGVVNFITSALSLNGINITQVISCHRETIFVVHRKDAPHAYQIIERPILDMRSKT